MIGYSIIIPVYNASRYLRECIDSVLLSIDKSKQIAEVICVNDGSVDDSLSILQAYGRRIRVIDQRNGGVSAARNRGVCEARGEYICFVDADDSVAPEWLIEYDANIRANGYPDMVCSPFVDGIPMPSTRVLFRWKWDGLIRAGYPWRFMVRREIAQKVEFPVGVAFGEDSIFSIRLSKYLHNVANLKKCLYLYRCSGDSAMTRKLASQERLSYLVNVESTIDALNGEYDVATISRMITGAIISWLARPKDEDKAVEIRKIFSRLRDRGVARICDVPLVFRPFYLFYANFGMRWPIKVGARIVSFLVNVKQRFGG